MISRRPGSAVRVTVLLGVAAVAVLIAGVAIGPVTIPVRETLSILFLGTDPESTQGGTALIIRHVRLPRVLLGFLVGGALAVSGAAMQGLFRNPLGSPYILGVASGASAGAAVAILAGWPAIPWLWISAFLGGLLATATVYRLSQGRDRRTSLFTLILAGVAVGALFSAVTSLAVFLGSRGERMADLVFWIMGGLGRASWAGLAVLAPVFLVGVAAVITWSRDLNAMALGEQGAFHLGVDPQRTARMLLGISTLLTSAAVAMTGTIGFVGLIVPHVLRLIIGPDHRVLIPASALGGGLFLVLADMAARTVMRPVEIPVGIITAFLGAPFFLYLLRSQGRRAP